MIPVILSGGSGTRLWPVSRQNLPKQFCSIFDMSLQDKTFIRCRELGTPWLITSQKLQTLTERSLAQLDSDAQTKVIYEPVGKNTAPAIAVLCKVALNLNLANEIAGVFPSDHLIGKEKTFKEVVAFATSVAATNKIVTLGITPSYPETGYGYIQTKAVKLLEQGPFRAYSVVKFHEKPTLDKAREFISQQSFSWNSGIFVFKISHMIDLFKQHQPAMWAAVEKLNTDFSNLADVYDQVQGISIDYAIMEKLSDSELACIPADFGWSDVGSWDAVSELVASKDVTEIKAEGTFVFGPSQKNYSVIGADNLILVDTDDALLVIQKGQSQDVRYVVDAVNQGQPELAKNHSYAYFKWGYTEDLKPSESSRARRVIVNPNSEWSDRAPHALHWTVVRGTGSVGLNGQTHELESGKYLSVPAGVEFSLKSQGNFIEIIEIQIA